MAKLRNRIELNKTNKQACGQLDVLCSDFVELENKYNALKYEYETVKANIKSRLDEDADYFTTQFKMVMVIQPAKTKFEYDMKKILEKYPEIAENTAFGDFKEKPEVKTLKSVEPLKPADKK